MSAGTTQLAISRPRNGDSRVRDWSGQHLDTAARAKVNAEVILMTEAIAEGSSFI
jgi:hypothetical protein